MPIGISKAIREVPLWEQTVSQFIKEIRETLKDYKPQAVRRVEIPKPNGKKRPLVLRQEKVPVKLKYFI